MEILNNEKSKSKVMTALVVLLIVASVYFAAKTVSEVKGLRFIGGGSTATSTISFDGKGEVTASPDLATISFTIRENAGTVTDAQTKVTTKEAAALAFLDKSGVAKKDIKAESINTSPKYDYGIPCYTYPCSTRTPKIIGYEVSEYISVKIHDLAKAGDIVKGLGDVGISEMNGPDFSIEKEDALKEQARKIAIDDAKAKAESLSKDLGISLIRIVNFSESGNYPMYSEKRMLAADSAGSVSSPAPVLPTGENKITSNVTITYEIR